MCWKYWGFPIFHLRKCSMTKNSANYYHIYLPLNRTPVSPCAWAQPYAGVQHTEAQVSCVKHIPTLLSDITLIA